MQGRYLAARNRFERRADHDTKTHYVIILEAEGKALCIQLRNRHIKAVQGDTVALHSLTPLLVPMAGCISSRIFGPFYT